MQNNMENKKEEKCEHGVVGKYCFRCKRPDLAGSPKPASPQKDSWEERLYYEVLEDLLFHQKMLEHHKNQAEGMEEIRQDIKKLEDFISSLLTAKEREVLERTFGEMIKEAKNLPNLFSPEVLRDKYLKPEKVWHFVHNFAESKGISLEDSQE